jgi:hypothetical protein
VGVDEEPPREEPPGLLSRRSRIVAGVFFGVVYAASFSLRGHIAAGLVGGVLGGLLMYLVLTEAGERRRRRARANDPRR